LAFWSDADISNDLRRRDSNKISNNIICLQSKIFINNKGNKQDLVILNYICINNNLNK